MDKPLHLDPEWLRQKYEVEKLSTYEIAAIVHRDPKRVYEKLVDFGIPTRPRGQNLAGAHHWTRVGAPNPFKGHVHTDETRKILSTKASVEKPHLRGKRNGMSGRTGATNPNYKDGSSPERQRLYASGEWKEIQRTVYKRDGYRCKRCNAAHKGYKVLHAHHIKPWACNPALRFDMSNLVTLCRQCHEWVHSTTNTKREYLG